MPLSPAPSRSSRSSVIKTTEIGFAGVEGALRHFGGVTEEVLLVEQMTIRLTRDHGFADSPLEEAGFEPSVPRKAPGVPAVPALVRAVFRLEGSRRNRWFESGSLQQRVRTKPLTPRA